MREMIAQLEKWRHGGEEIALVTLVSACGSTPRLAGARLAVTRSGKMAGSVSGGCVESDIFARALQVLERNEPALASYGVADDAGLRVGLSCGGTIEVLIEPFAAAEAWQALAGSLARRRPAALATALAPHDLIGRKLVVVDEQAIGSITPALDEWVRAEAERARRDGGARVVDAPWGAERARLFVEGFAPAARLLVIGATHTAVALARLARSLDFAVTVIDARAVYATPERFPGVEDLRAQPPLAALAESGLDSSSYVVVLTHDPQLDAALLACALRSEARYIGALGSRATQRIRRALLSEQGFTAADIARIRAPIGLDIGARTPEEIALSIMAEMIAARSGRSGRPLVDGEGPIRG